MDLDETIKTAVEFYKTGDLAQAEEVCKQILDEHPDNIDVLHFLGILYYQRGIYDTAEEYFRKGLKIDHDNSDLLCNMGNTLKQRGQLDEAMEYYEKAIQTNPTYGDTYNSVGYILHSRGKIDEAIAYYQKAAELEPEFGDAYYNLGTAFQDKNQLDEAIGYYQKAVELEPDLDDAYYNLGIIWQEKKKIDDAIACYQKTLELNPRHANAHNNLGTIYRDQKQNDKALIHFYHALRADPGLAMVHISLGSIYQEQGRLDEAITCYQKALEINPDMDYALNNLGRAFRDKGRIQEAIDCFRKSLRLNPGNAFTHWNIGEALLLTGDFKQGWKEYQWLWKAVDVPQYNIPQPLWDGSDIQGHSVLLHLEPGSTEDAIQFIRYVPLIVQKGAKVIVECPKELAAVLKGVEGVSQVVVQEDHLPDFDLHAPLLSLPSIFDSGPDSIPVKVPYISVDRAFADKWKERIQPDTVKMKIGITWARNPIDKHDHYQTFALEAFKLLGGIEQVGWYSLQQGWAAEQAKHPPEGMRLFDYTEDIRDLMDMAGLIENLDLVISVDTLAAHLAGAMGKTVWTIIPYAPDWRWMLDREDSPWYPAMRLFRQPETEDWAPVMERIKEELKSLIK
jgi:tetratricopeptide (TPR) repeat protein